MLTGWSGSLSGTRAAKSGRESFPSRDLWPMSSAGFRRRSGRRPRAGPRKGSIKPRTASTAPVKCRSRIRRWRVPTRPCLPLLPAQDGALPDRTVPCVDHSTQDAGCWCQYKIQTREHLFKNCPQWKSQQKTLWTTILEETRKLPGPTRGKDRTKIAELFADERCS